MSDFTQGAVIAASAIVAICAVYIACNVHDIAFQLGRIVSVMANR